MMKRLLIAVTVMGGSMFAQMKVPEPKIPFKPRYYMCFKTLAPIVIDGKLDDVSWKKVDWTEKFVDIEGGSKPKPRFETRVKVLWDDQYLYVAADIEENNIWATLKERDSILYDENDFEILIDPDGDTHNTYELEINALNTVSDIFHIKPYRDDHNVAVRAWDIRDLKSGVSLEGTANNPKDKDKRWTVEVAMPWATLRECAPLQKAPPDPGDQWRMNFSRIEYRLDAENGVPVKAKIPGSGEPYAEDNWVWSPQGLIDIDYPEMWGFVQFTNSPAGSPREYCDELPDDDVKWALRRIYYRERAFKHDRGVFSTSLTELGLGNERDLKIKGWTYPPILQVTESFFEATYHDKKGTSWRIGQDGLAWKNE